LKGMKGGCQRRPGVKPGIGFLLELYIIYNFTPDSEFLKRLKMNPMMGSIILFMRQFLLLTMILSSFFILSLWSVSTQTLGLLPSEWVELRVGSLFPKDNFAAEMLLVTDTPTPITTSTPLENGDIYHVVQSNEALWSIAIAYNTTIDTLKLLNGLSTDEIFAGQKLLVFKHQPATVTPTKVITATLGIPTSTATQPLTATNTFTPTSVPLPPSSLQGGGSVLGAIVLIALLAAGLGSWLGRKKPV